MKVTLKRKIGYGLTYDNDYIVLGIYIYINDKDMRYLIKGDNNLGLLYDAKLFNIIDGRTSPQWECFCDDRQMILSFPDFFVDNFIYNIATYDGIENSILKKRFENTLTWYRNMEIDDFFKDAEKYGITQKEKETMLSYYKSQPDGTQWQADKELLMSNHK